MDFVLFELQGQTPKVCPKVWFWTPLSMPTSIFPDTLKNIHKYNSEQC